MHTNYTTTDINTNISDYDTTNTSGIIYGSVIYIIDTYYDVAKEIKTLKQTLSNYLKNTKIKEIFNPVIKINNSIVKISIIRKIMFSISGWIQNKARKKLKNK